MAQQVTELDDNGNPVQALDDEGNPISSSAPITPVTTKPITPPVTTPQPEPQQGMLSRAWNAISEPITDAPSRFASSVANWMDTPNLNRTPMAARISGFGAGALEGIGDLVSGLTSPINLGTTVLTGGSSLAARQGLTQTARLANLGAKATATPVITHGAINIVHPESTLAERAMGVAEVAGGGAALRTPKPSSPTAKVKGAKEPEMYIPPPEKHIGKSGHTEIAEGIVDKYDVYRQVPLGTRYTVSPSDINRRKMVEAIRLGFDVSLAEDGKVILKKVRPSPQVKLPSMNPVQESKLLEAANVPRTLMASMDMSAPLRQGIGLIHKKAFWTSLPEMFKAWGSEDYFQQAMKGITSDPLFQKRVTAGGKVRPSFAEEAGLALTDLKHMSSREESIMSSIAERVPGVRRSNRAYTLFLNKLRADAFKQLTKDFKAYSGMDMRNNLPLAKELAKFVNTASGRGSLGPAENSAKVLSSVLFSPRLIASRLGMMRSATSLFSPEVYMSKSPSVRREYLKSLFSIAATAGTFVTLAKASGAELEGDPGSSDFGKPKFGDTRIDPYAGFQQYITLAQRLMPHIDLSSQGLGEIGGMMKSTTTGREYSLDDAGFGRSNRADVLLRFVRSKTNPVINFAWGLMAGQKELSGKPMNFSAVNPVGAQGENIMDNSIMQRFAPMLTQDIYELAQSETTPAEAKALAAFLASVGMGSQTYSN